MGRAIVNREIKIQELTAEIARLRGLLGRLEWAGGEVEGDCRRFDACPECSAREGYDKHRPDCWLAAELEGNR